MPRRNKFNLGGRPSLPKRERKSMVLCARADSETYRACRRAADRAGMRFTDWMRTRLAEAALRDLAA
jgi:hypothetical protein